MAETRRRNIQKREEPVETVPAPQPEAPDEAIEPNVSVVLTAHNQAAALRRSIEALERSQDRERFEIIVVDCGSRDESAQLDSEYEGITMLRLPLHFGATKALNIGTRTAKAELIFYLSPNVEVAADTVSKLASQLESEGETVAVSPLLADPEGRVVSKVRSIPVRETVRNPQPGADVDLSQESVAVEYPDWDALMIRRQFIKGMNYFDERYGHSWADADLAVQIRRAQKKARIFPAIRATYHAAPDPLAGDALAAADRELGAAAFIGKYQGMFAGLGYRIGAILRALGRFSFRELGALVTGQKLDGSQAM